MHNDFRFYYSKQSREVYEENSYGDRKLFPQRSDMFFWCVALGYRNASGRPKKLSVSEKGRGEIHWGAFDDEVQKPFLNMIAVEACQEFEVLGSSAESNEQFREVIQAYAESGFTILCAHMDGYFTADKLMEVIVEEVSQ